MRRMQAESGKGREEWTFFSRHPTGLMLSASLGATGLALLALRVRATVVERRIIAKLEDPDGPDFLILNLLSVLDPVVAGAAAASLLAFLLSPKRPVRRRYQRLGAAGLVAGAMAGTGSAILFVLT